MLSPAVVANGTLYLSGQGGGSTKDFAGQMGEAMGNVQTVLRGAGMDFGNVVWMNIYLTDPTTWPRWRMFIGR